MKTYEVINHIENLEIENRTLKEEQKGKLDATKFYSAAVTVQMISILHGVHADTVRKYVEFGLIERHPDSTDAKILVRGSEALLLDFRELRKKHIYRNNPKRKM